MSQWTDKQQMEREAISEGRAATGGKPSGWTASGPGAELSVCPVGTWAKPKATRSGAAKPRLQAEAQQARLSNRVGGSLGESERNECMWVTERAPLGRAASNMAKQYLYGYLALKRRRSALMEEWEQVRQAATRATSRVTAVRVSGTGRKDGMANAVLRSVEIEERLKRLLDHLAEAMDARLWMIEQISDEWEKTVLTQRYICGKRWEEIAANLPFEIAQVYRIHGRALQSFWRVYVKTRDVKGGGG